MMLSDVCLSVAYIGLKSRTERPRNTEIDTEIAHITRYSDTTFKVKGLGHQAALLTMALTRQAAAAVSVGTYCYVAVGSATRGEALWRPQRVDGGGACCGGLPPTSCLACAAIRCCWFWTKVTSCARGDTICLRLLQVDNIFALIRQVAHAPACWLFKTSATS